MPYLSTSRLNVSKKSNSHAPKLLDLIEAGQGNGCEESQPRPPGSLSLDAPAPCTQLQLADGAPRTLDASRLYLRKIRRKKCAKY